MGDQLPYCGKHSFFPSSAKYPPTGLQMLQAFRPGVQGPVRPLGGLPQPPTMGHPQMQPQFMRPQQQLQGPRGGPMQPSPAQGMQPSASTPQSTPGRPPIGNPNTPIISMIAHRARVWKGCGELQQVATCIGPVRRTSRTEVASTGWRICMKM